MSLIQIAWRNFRHRSLSSFLTTVSLALGVGLVVLVLSIFGIVREAFKSNAQVGYNLVVGPKGSALQLTLNSVFYLSQPIENLPFTEYMEFFDAKTRAEMVRRYGGDPALGEVDGKYSAFVLPSPMDAVTSEEAVPIQPGANVVEIPEDEIDPEANSQLQISLAVENGTLTLASSAGITFVDGENGASELTVSGLESDLRAAFDGLEFDPAEESKGGDTLSITTVRYPPPGYVIPLALGDYYGEFRAVGTTPDFFEKLRHGAQLNKKFTFQSGRAFEEYNKENKFFEAVLGSRVAAEMGITVGEEFKPTHGDPEGKGHGQGFVVAGILDPTGTPNDRAAFVNLEGFYLLEKHAKPLNGDEIIEPATEGFNDPVWTQLTIPEREVTSILLRTGSPFYGPSAENMINESLRAQAAAPVGEINKLMDAIVGPLLNALLIITLITCVVAAFGILVAIYNSMNDRRRDIAVMRALGARRDTVTMIILCESLLIAVIGGVLGWVLAHVAIWFYSPSIEDQTGIQVGLFSMSEYELWVLPLVVILSLIAGLLPAFAAYRTDVGSNLAA